MKLIITRHGETIENIKGIMQGHLPGKLSKEGIEQAKKLALRLKDDGIDFIYSSDLARAADTAKEIAKYHKSTPLRFVKELRERNHGEFQGKEKSKYGWGHDGKNKRFIEPKHGETSKQLYERAKKFFNTISKNHKEDTLLLVGHGGINRALIAVITNKDSNIIKKSGSLKNTSVNIIEINKDGCKLHLFNCTKHLD